MKAKTAAGARLKRLAREHALAYADYTWKGYGETADRPGIEKRLASARKKLYDEIDRLTSADMTPRAVAEVETPDRYLDDEQRIQRTVDEYGSTCNPKIHGE